MCGIACPKQSDVQMKTIRELAHYFSINQIIMIINCRTQIQLRFLLEIICNVIRVFQGTLSIRDLMIVAEHI